MVVVMVVVFGLGSILMGEGGFVKCMCVYVCRVCQYECEGDIPTIYSTSIKCTCIE